MNDVRGFKKLDLILNTSPYPQFYNRAFYKHDITLIHYSYIDSLLLSYMSPYPQFYHRAFYKHDVTLIHYSYIDSLFLSYIINPIFEMLHWVQYLHFTMYVSVNKILFPIEMETDTDKSSKCKDVENLYPLDKYAMCIGT